MQVQSMRFWIVWTDPEAGRERVISMGTRSYCQSHFLNGDEERVSMRRLCAPHARDCDLGTGLMCLFGMRSAAVWGAITGSL